MSATSSISARHSVGTKLLRIVFFIYIIFAIVLTAMHMYLEYQRVKKDVVGELSALHATFGKPLSIAVWDADKEQIASLLEGLVASHLILGVSVEEVGGDVVREIGRVISRTGSKEFDDQHGIRIQKLGGKGNLFGYKFTLSYSESDTPNLLGYVSLFSSEIIIFNKLKYQFVYIFLSALLKAMFLWIVFLFFARKMLTIPLSELAWRASEIDMDNLQPIKLKEADHDSKNEISLLQSAFNTMVRNLRFGVQRQEALYSELDGYKNDLQNLVNERTDELQKANEDLTSQVRERQEAEDRVRRYGSILEESLTEVFIVDAENLRFLLANKGARNNLGYTMEELSELTPLDITQYSSESFQELLRPLVEKKVEFLNVETVQKRKDGSIYDVDVHIQSMMLAERKVFVANVLDTSEKKQLEERLRQSHKMEAVGTIAGGVAHDFNNILSVIIGNTELALAESGNNENLLSSLDDIKAASYRARDVVSQLLSFSRKGDKTQKPIYLKGVIGESMKFLRSTTPSSVDIQLDIKDDTGFVIADYTQIYQLIINVSTNSVHSLDENGGVLKIGLEEKFLPEPIETIHNKLRAGNYLCLSFTDNGCGISEQNLDKIFDPYFTTKEIGKGSGLGLSVVHGIVTDCNGGINVESNEGKGTTVTIFLPCSESEPAMDIEEAATGNHSGKERIMIIDDEEPILRFVKKVFESKGYTVLPFLDPLAAKEYYKVKGSEVDLVISDMTMPKLNGIKLSEEISVIDPQARIILCSGFNEEKGKQIHPEGAIKKFLQKPFSQSELLSAAREILDS